MHKLSAAIPLLLAVVHLPANISYAVDKKPGEPVAAGLEGGEKKQERVCEAEVYYSWQPPRPKQEPHPAGVAPPPPPAIPSPVEVLFTKSTERGTGGDEAIKKRLLGAISVAKNNALVECQSQHQNQAQCVSRKLKSISADYSRLDYQSQRTFREAITDDCRSQAGLCLSTRVGEVSCSDDTQAEIAPPAETDPKVPAAAEKKKK